MSELRIGIIGDFNATYAVHQFTNDCFHHVAKHRGARIQAEWLATDTCHTLANYQGFLVAPGTPYESFEGALDMIRYARENNIPLLATCGGFQHMMIEFARNVAKIEDADHEEMNPHGANTVITRLVCSLAGQTQKIAIVPTSATANYYGREESLESFYCNYGLNPAYTQRLVECGIKVSGYDDTNEVRIVEFPGHPFYLGTLFVPQAQSTESNPHPLIDALCVAAGSRQTASAFMAPLA